MFIAQSKDTGRGGEKILSVFINPEVSIENFTQSIEVEGCLSVPDVWEKVPRYIGVRVRYYNRNGKRFVSRYDDFIAQLIQHENDHLDGVLFIDKSEK
jgi:peptide deformylase